MKISAALTAAVFAAVATAKDEDYGRNITTVQHVMPQFVNPFQPNIKGKAARSSHKKTTSISNTLGSTVEPGKVVTKAERQRRRTDRADSAIETLDGQADENLDYETEHNWAAFKAKVAADIRFSEHVRRLDQDIDENFPPGSCLDYVSDFKTGRGCCSPRSLIVSIICFLLVFGALYTLFNYLLFSTRASACSISTVYLPITYTVTSGAVPASPLSGANGTSPAVTSTSTFTQTTTIMQTETVTSFFPTSDTSETGTGGTTYAYATNSVGSTVWVNGVSPSSGAILATITKTVTMLPLPPTDPALSTLTDITTITPPAYTSTVYSYDAPDITITSTSTHYITRTLSLVSSPPTITTTRTTFTGVNTSGWNVTSSGDPVGAAQTSDPESTTITVISYFGSGTETTSTKTMFITTTIAIVYTTTIYEPVESPVGTGYVTTITALPVTITPVASGPLFSTSVPFVNVTLPSTKSGSAVAGPHSTALRSLSVSHVGGSGGSSPSPLATTTSGIFQNSTNSAGPTGNPSPSIVTTLTSFPGYSPGPSQSTPSVSAATPQSITRTVSAAAQTGSPSPSTLQWSSPSPQTSISGAVNGTNGITKTLTNIGSSTVSNLGSNYTKSALSNASPQTLSSTVSSSASNGSPTGIASAINSTSSSPVVNSTSSSAAYGYPNPGSSSPPTPINSSTSAYSRSAPRPATPPQNSPPSTLATSTRSIPSFNNSSSLAPSHGTGSSNSPPHGSSTAATSIHPQPHITQSKQSTFSRNVTTTLSPNTTASNPFPPSSATATPTGGCGEQGSFTINFDNLPRFLPTNPNTTAITQAPPIPNPYYHLTFSDGYVYAPEPSEPYQPVSPPHLAVFLANATGKMSTPFGNLVKPGEIGDGPRDSISAFWFDATSAYFGCDNMGPGACNLVFTAYKWNQAANHETMSSKYNATIPACTTMSSLNCQLQKVTFPQSFRSLSGIQIQAFTGNDQRMFFMDNLTLDWTNKTCAAGLLRQSSQ